MILNQGSSGQESGSTNNTKPRWKKSAIVYLLIFLVNLFVLFSITSYLNEHDFISLNLLFFAEKSSLALDGYPPRLENIGLVYPPVPFVFFLIFRDPVLVQSLAAALSVTFLVTMLMKAEKRLSILSLAYIYLSPVFFYLTTQRFDILLFYITFALSVYTLFLYHEKGLSYYMFVSSVLLALTFLMNFQILLLAPFMIILNLAAFGGDLRKKVAITLAQIAPLIFVAVGWAYLNWIFTGDPLNFVYSPHSAFIVRDADVELLELGYFRKLMFFLYQLPVVLPYVYGFFLLRLKRAEYLFPLLLALAVVVLNIPLVSGFSYHSLYSTALYLIFFFIFVGLMNRSRLLWPALLTSFIFSFMLVMSSGDEARFAKAVLTGEVEGNIREYKEVADFIRASGGKVLADDSDSFPVVYLAGDPKLFVLPYQYEFVTDLSNPSLTVEYVLANKRSDGDVVLRRFPSAREGTLNHFDIAFENDRFVVFRTNRPV